MRPMNARSESSGIEGPVGRPEEGASQPSLLNQPRPFASTTAANCRETRRMRSSVGWGRNRKAADSS